MTDLKDEIENYLPAFQDGYIPREEVAQGLVDLIIARIPPLLWRVYTRRTSFAQRMYFSGNYCIEHRLHGDDEFDLWIGPDAVKAQRFNTLETAEAAANAHHVAQLCKGMGIK